MTATIPLCDVANAWLAGLPNAPDGATLLGERAMLAGLCIPSGNRSAGGGCQLFGTLALNLARPDDRDLLPALFATDELDPSDDTAIAAWINKSNAAALVRRGRSLGLAIACENETTSALPACAVMTAAPLAPPPASRPPRVLDLSALWAGPLAAHLLGLAGANVVKLESRTRPDAMRHGDSDFFTLLNQGKASVVVDLAAIDSRRALLSLITAADIVIEASRPRALAQLGIDADALVRATPGLTWITITAHGTTGEHADWVGFGDDCGVAGGLTAALRAATGAAGFVGDAIADPLTGILAAQTAWTAWRSGQGGHFGLSMRGVAALALAQALDANGPALAASLRAWREAAGQAFPPVRRRPVGHLPAWGAHTRARLAAVAPC